MWRLALQNLSVVNRLLKGGSGLVAELQLRDDKICADHAPVTGLGAAAIEGWSA